MTAQQLEKLIAGAVSLVEAHAAKDSGPGSLDRDFRSIASDAAGRVLRGVEATSHISEETSENWKRQILWVDDRPDNNRYERNAFESFDIKFTLALSTKEALGILDRQRFAAIISDMGRREGAREGYKLLELVRSRDQSTPFFIYTGSRAPEHRKEAAECGAQGTTNNAGELIDMVTAALQRVD